MKSNGTNAPTAGINGRSKYKNALAASWVAHGAPRASSAPTVVSLFAGCGGSSLGYSIAGYRELLAVEWDDNAVEVLRLNFPNLDVYHGDIAKLSVEDVLNRTGLKPRELDVLDGSPPCQGFSTAGRRQLNDSRNQLFREYVRLLKGLQPKVLVMENVSGMVKGKMKLLFAEILQELRSVGYRVSARLLNAMYFGVPQARQRMIFVGVRNDLGIEPSHPKATSFPIPVKDAIYGAVIDDTGKPSERFIPRMKRVKPGQSLAKAEGTSSHFSYIRTHWDKPSSTVMKMIPAGISMWHPKEERNLSIGEFKRISSFPDEFRFTGTYNDAVNRIGNSVPPLFMAAIARHIRINILEVGSGKTL